MSPRLKKCFQLFDREGIDALLVSSWSNVTYLSAFKGTESWIFISPKGLYFITDSRYSEQAEDEAKGFNVILRDKKSVTEIVKDLADTHQVKKLGFEAPVVTYSFYSALAKRLGESRIKPTANIVESLRIIKDAREIKSIQKSADIAVKGFHHVRKPPVPA